MTDPGRDHARIVADRYSADAPAYRRHWAPELLPMGTRLVASLGLFDARRILDLGAGVGSLLSRIRDAAPSAVVIACDRSGGMLALAPGSFPRVVADAAELPFADGSFDAAVLAFMLFHLQDPAAGLREVRRVLGPGGAVGTATWGKEELGAALEAWVDELDAAGAPADPAAPDHGLVDTEEKVTGLLEAVGFTDVDTRLEVLEYTVDADEFVARRTGFGQCRRRLEMLAPDARAAFVERAVGRVRVLSPEAFASRSEVVLARARKADA